ncbi:MAG TPA: nitrilase-related carbon-nitrogen hydrolase [Candidatus Marinimicrobia bacterium]|nr:nitrilase-related carbon-nitrogen hydrolase [Candidatus Neomarinimicrobiota bacterium]HRS51772.1 nitrilase-related carbon-nitrogen hydrolase [Candidatus Neomarinimicrobiota bacterium]HRU93042.1 nitrilase-related carbon-nitrogen hydrolase [Candidatus Neomarinimicrobiota bacterium]
MKIAVDQFAPIWGEINTNIENISQTIASQAADLWVLPELCTTGYLFSSVAELKTMAENVKEGATVQALSKLSRQHRTALVFGIAEKCGDQIFNSAVVLDRGEICAVYRKVHLFNEEKKLFSAGTETPPVIEIQGVKVGVMICFDWFFPEMARTLALQGAQIIAHPANLVLPYCQTAMLTRSLENRVFTATANRIGSEMLGDKKLTFTGKSQITNPRGALLGQLEADRPGILVRDIDPAEALDKSLTPLNDIFEDRRPEIYQLGKSSG